MKIGLIDVDGHASKKKWGAIIYPNLALCKIASYHKMKGDHVEWYDGMFGGEYDIVYMAKVFSFSKDYMGFVNAKTIIKGGTGYDVHSKLPLEIDDCQPDYTIYPNVPGDVSYGFLTRGCPNKCSWCVVPEKEGKIRPYWDVDRVANGRKKIVLMDNNLLAAGDYAHEQLDKIIAKGYHIDLNQANDARLVTDEFARQFARVKWIHGRIRFGCDTTAQIKFCEEAMEKINSYGFKGEYFLYTMIGGGCPRTTDHKSEILQSVSSSDDSCLSYGNNYQLLGDNTSNPSSATYNLKVENSQNRVLGRPGGGNGLEECYDRIRFWREKLMDWRREKRGRPVYAYAQPYRDPHKSGNEIPMWQKDMAGWCNKRMLFVSCDFKDFQPRKGFRCDEYFKVST